MQNLIKATYLRKILVSYTIIFIVPFIIFSLIFQFRYKDILEEELIKNTQKNLTALETNVVNETDQLDMIVFQNIISRNLLPFDFRETPLEATERIATLNQYTQANSFIEDILLFYNDEDFIYSSESSHTLSKTFSMVYDFQQWPVETMIKDLNNRSTKYIIPRTPIQIYTQNKLDHYTVISYPLTTEGLTYYGNLLFMIDEESFSGMIENVYDDENNLTLILDENAQVIHQKGLLYLDYTQLLGSYSETGQISSTTTSYQGNEYLVTTTYSEDLHWTFVNITSVNTALNTAIQTQRTFFILSIGLFIFGMTTIFILMRYNYKPIRSLLNFSKKVTEHEQDDGLKKPYNEIESIKHALEFLSDENNVLNEVIDDAKVASKSYIISQILSGQSLKSEMIDREIISTIMSPEMTHYNTFMVSISQEEQLWSDMKFDIMSDIESFSTNDVFLIAKESVMANSITVLCAMTKQTTVDYDFMLNKILVSLSNKWKAEVTIGVGIIYDSLDVLPKSYMGASTAIDYRLMVGTGSVIYYKDIVGNMKKITTYPYTDLELFKLSIKKGNVQDIDNILNNLVKQFACNTIPIFVARGICYEIINSVISNYEELGMDYDESFEKYPDIFSITKYESISKIIELIKLISYDVCKALSHTYDDDNKILIANMDDYINDNYMDSCFSLQSMADHYNMLPPNLSSFYKENSGNNIFEVVTELRMKTAKELLTTSKLPINQICVKIGYDNVSSFIRRFKQFSGITPGKFRDINR